MALAFFFSYLVAQTLVVATNRNDILTQFFATGRYQRQPEVFQTPSPAMDIQISSNFERYLYYLAAASSLRGCRHSRRPVCSRSRTRSCTRHVPRLRLWPSTMRRYV